MKNKIKLKNKIFIALTTLVVGVASMPFHPSLSSIEKTYAYTPTEITVSNGDFSSTTTSSYPRTASNWTKADGVVSSSTIKAGVISTVLDTFKEEYESYGLAIENTSGLENSNNLNVYMINGLDKSVRYGVKSSEISLDAESYYKVSVEVKTSLPVLIGDTTLDLSSMASIYLNVGDESYSFVGVNTYNGWDTYTFYVHTNKFEAPSINVELWLGGKTEFQSSGAVLFDNVKVTKLASENWYSKNDATNKIVELDNFSEYDASNKINNPSFENINEIWELEVNEKNHASTVTTGISSLVSYNQSVTNISTNPKTNGKAGNTSALFINNASEAGTEFRSNNFVIEKYTNYLIQVYVKTGEFEEGGATIAIVPTNEDLEKSEFTNIVTSTTTNSITNDWTQYSFYVQGSPFSDEEVYLQLSVGSTSEDDLVKGYAFFDDVTISKITYSQFNNYNSNNAKQVKLHNITSTSEIANAGFNLVDDAFTGTYPLNPSSWTASNKDNTETSGIISTRKDDFESKTATYYGNIPWYCVGLTPLQTNVDENTADNNVLMIYNKNNDYQSYTSSSYNLTSGSYYKISIDARTLTTGKAFIKVKVGGNVVANYNFTSETEWTTFETLIATGLGDKEISVELGLGTSSDLVNGYAFFDNVRVISLDEEEFTTAKNDIEENIENISIVDFTNEDFSLVTGEKDGELETPSNWTTETSNKTTNTIGIVNEEDANALLISTTEIDNTVTSDSKITYKLDASNYYVATFKIKTSEFASLENSGASFGFKEVENSFFKNIINASQDYIEYKFYINGAEYSSLTPYLQLNVANATNTEFVKLSSISFEEISTTDFTEKLEEIADDNTITDVIILGNVTEEEHDHDHDHEYIAPAFDWYLIPTIITTIALILAVIGVILQKRKRTAKKKEKQKKFVNKYDREITLHKALIDREAEAIRKQRLDELKSKLKLADEELEQIELEYKEKLADANTNKEHEFKKYARTRKKVAERKEQLEEEKKYVESDEFMEEATNKVIETYEPEEHSEEVAEMAKEQNIDLTDNSEKKEEEIEVEIVNPDDDKKDNN